MLHFHHSCMVQLGIAGYEYEMLLSSGKKAMSPKNYHAVLCKHDFDIMRRFCFPLPFTPHSRTPAGQAHGKISFGELVKAAMGDR